MGELLITKNQAYGDSALNPIGIFSPGKASDLIRVRMDDKLSRIANDPEAFGEDPVPGSDGLSDPVRTGRRG